MQRPVLPFAALVGLCGSLFVPLFAQPKVEEALLGPYDPSKTPPSFSRNGMHIAIPAAKGSRTVIIVDGVEGPRIDRIQNTVLFSDDGLRHAYVGMVGTEAILVLDGKEVARLPAEQGMASIQDLVFSPQGKRFCYQRKEERGAISRLVMDGQIGEPYQSIQNLVFSPDETRFAYLGSKGDATGKMNLVVDGKDVGYQGVNPQFSPDGRTVVTVGHTPTESVLLMNGKPGSRAKSIRGVHMSKAGVNLLVIGKNPGNADNGEFIGSGGKKIEGTDCDRVEWLKFSPDGKRYAALCSVGGGVKYLVIDGKKGDTYEGITDFKFSDDSKRTMFFGRTSAGTFLVIDGEESDAYVNYQRPSFGGGGKRAGYIGGIAGSRAVDVVVDGRITKLNGGTGLEFSPDGNRYAVIASDGFFGALYLDGVEQPGVTVIPPNNPASDAPWVAFSPDGKHVAHFGALGNARDKRGLIVDGKMLGGMNGLYRAATFSPDGLHVFAFSQNPGNGKAFALLVDGKPVVVFDFLPFSNVGAPGPVYPAAMGDDGVFTFIGGQDGVFKRFRVTAM